MHRIVELEGLRGWLSTWVVLGHISACAAWQVPAPLPKNLSSGSPVQTFIVLSGFAITLLLLDARESYPRYLLRRFLRLWPAFAVCLGLAVLLLDVSWEGLHLAPQTPGIGLRKAIMASSREHLGAHLLWHLSMLHGLVDPWLPHSSHALIGPAWSVSVEWQFYCLAPLAVAVFVRGRLAAAFALLVLAGLYLHPRMALPGSLGVYCDLFLLGMLTGQAYRLLRDGGWQPSLPALRAASLGVFVVATLVLRRPLPVGVWCLAAHVCFAVRLAAAAGLAPGTPGTPGSVGGPERWLARALAAAPSQWLGACSYSLYLCHVLVLYPALWLLARAGIDAPGWQAAGLLAIVLPTSLLLARLLHRWVEQPCIALGRRATLS